MSLKFEFIGNACGVFIGSGGTRILCDPWITDGVFEGSWCHFPPLETQIADIQSVDAIYVSHIHPDHFDERAFDFNRETPILILNRPNNFLEKRLLALGYSDVRLLDHGKRVHFQEFELAIYEPFTTHNFHDAVVGNVIDSALIVKSDGTVAFNANDNTPTPDACRELVDEWGRIDLAMLNYNAAGPYPACFDNLSDDEKVEEHSRILNRNMSYMVQLLEVLSPRACLPFAGAYVLGGKLANKNPYLGTTSWDVCADYLRSHLPDLKVVTMRETDILDLVNLETDRPYVALDSAWQQKYINEVLSKLKYPYEADDLPDESILLSDLEDASQRMRKRADAMGLTTEFSVQIETGSLSIQVYPEFSASAPPLNRHLKCSIDSRLMRRILDRKAQWNSAEIGCHISFVRTPNDYNPDLHTMLQFLHL